MRLRIFGTAVLLMSGAFQGAGWSPRLSPRAGDGLNAAHSLLQRQLASDDPKEVAWGAYLAAQNQRRAVVPLLQERLTALSATNSSSLPTALAILDALVQLDAKLPAQDLGSWIDRCPVQTLILLANASSGRDEVLLSMLESTSGFRWYAAANPLLMTKPPGFAARWRWAAAMVLADRTRS
jgi:hypothetical protein